MASSATTAPAIPVFSGTHYHIWAVKMKTYLKSQGLWKVVETDESTPALGENPTVAQLRTYDTESLKKDKALTCLHSGIADQIFTSIMDLETPKAVVKKARNNTQGVQQVNVFEEDQVDDERLFMASHHDKHPNSLTWLMDSGCTSHMTPERSFFISLDTKDNPRVKLGDGRYTRAKGRAILDMVNDSYYLKLDVANASAFSVTEDDSMKWDKRNGHFNYRTLKHMNTTKLVRDYAFLLVKLIFSEFDIEDSTGCSKHFEWINAMKVKLEEEIYVKQPQAFEVEEFNRKSRATWKIKAYQFQVSCHSRSWKNEKVKLNTAHLTQIGDSFTKGDYRKEAKLLQGSAYGIQQQS
ncbi:retrovirus-related pol polyprotein from transposon TNT 1-94 [Tanacetum coccineum]|uniref:Retrovirus-related pol polyprotein from transposon TNT 1-94 n=1 Tax=Tanacetum coccineum TaxID=301880 RepID=A0ABQ5CZ69_9ASTR